MSKKNAAAAATPKPAPLAAAKPDHPEKEFAEWLGSLAQGKIKSTDPTIQHLVGDLTALQKQHTELAQRLAQGQQEIINARNELSKIEGRIEQGVQTIRHLRGKASPSA